MTKHTLNESWKQKVFSSFVCFAGTQHLLHLSESRIHISSFERKLFYIFLHIHLHDPFYWRRHLCYFLTLIRFKIGGLVLLLHTFPYNTPDILDARYFIVYDFFLLSFAFILNWIVSPHKCEEHTPSAKQRATKKMVIWHFEEANVKERVRVM